MFPSKHLTPKSTKSRAMAATYRYFGTDGLDTEQHAREYHAASHGMCYLSPYNDKDVIAGQGTCGVEIIEQLPDIDVAFIAVGGGGLIGGVGSVFKTHNSAIQIYGCQPKASAVMAHSIEAGEILELPSEKYTVGWHGGRHRAGAITFALNQAVVDEFVRRR